MEADLRTRYALAVLFRDMGQELGRSLPPKEKPAKELPHAWRLALVDVMFRYELAADSGRAEPPASAEASGLTSYIKTGDIRVGMGHNGQTDV